MTLLLSSIRLYMLRTGVTDMNLNELLGYKNNQDYLVFKDTVKDTGVIDGKLSYKDTQQRKSNLRHFRDYLKLRGFKMLGSGHYAIVFTHPTLDFCIKLFRKDEGYQTFLRFCWANKGNTCLPKFFGKIMKIDDNYFAVRMEKLKRMTAAQYSLFEDIEFHLDKNDYLKQEYPNLDQTQPNLVSTLITLFDHNDGTLNIDIHECNVMMRGDTFVITDPFTHMADIGID